MCGLPFIAPRQQPADTHKASSLHSCAHPVWSYASSDAPVRVQTVPTAIAASVFGIRIINSIVFVRAGPRHLVVSAISARLPDPSLSSAAC